MAADSLKIIVPEPCSESWNAMLEQPAGRFCGSCEKVVIDFSSYSDQQLLAFFSNPPEKVCGRFTGKQLDHSLLPEPKLFSAKRSWPKVAAGIALWLGVSAQGQAQQQLTMGKPLLPKSQEIPKKADTEATGQRLKAKPAGNLEIGGVLIDALTQEPVPFGNVLIKNTKFYAQTDVAGKFTFVLPADSVAETVDLYAPNIGYETGNFTYPKAAFLDGVEVRLELKQSAQILTGIVVVTRISADTRLSVWQRFKNLFRSHKNR